MQLSLKKMGSFGLVLVLLFLGFYSLRGQEKVFADHNCAITPPTGWQWLTNLPPQEAFYAAFGNTARTRIITLVIDDRHKSGPMSEGFVAEFDKGVERSGGGKRVSGKFIEVAGLKSYERHGPVRVKGKEGSTIIRVVPTAGAIYTVEAMSFDEEVSEDAEIREALGSFRFIRPPSPPARSASAAYQFGYMMGKLVPAVLLGVAIIVIIGILIFQRVIKRRQRPPPLPRIHS